VDKNNSRTVDKSKTSSHTKQMYSKKVIEYANAPVNMGRMNDPSASAWIKGACGETIEIYLIIENHKIKAATFFTNGCGPTLACGSTVTLLAIDKSIDDVLSISPRNIIDHLDGLPEENIHCAILAASTLYKAIADYLLQY
jgi:nitrogen fixation NifU-like protein